MITTSETSKLSPSQRSTRRGRAFRVGLEVTAWAALILAVLVTTILAGWVLLGVVLLGSGPAAGGAPVPVILLALVMLSGLLAWLTARHVASWRRVGEASGLIVVLVSLLGVIGAVAAPTQALYLARTMAWGASTVYTYQKLFLSHPLYAAATPFHFAASPDPRVEELFGKLSGSSDWNGFLEKNDTQAFIVMRAGQVVYEHYFNDTKRDSMLTSFSVAKSFTSALIGKAIQDGFMRSVDDPITEYLPELAQRDPRFKAITIRNLLMMASGLDYQENRPFIVNGDDPLTTYFPDQRQVALENTHIIAPPGQYWLYNKYHPQLLGMILERTTGMSVTHYLQKTLWEPLGMEYDGSWSIDSQQSNFEKMEAGVNARAIDFAKFGELFLNGGSWQGKQIIAKEWVDESTQPYLPNQYASYYPQWFVTPYGRTYYTLMWWGITRGEGGYDFYAAGDHGQYIYVSPQKQLVIVRNGLNYGIPSEQWRKLFYDFASQY